ncbi:MAG TPA: TM0106 family RecB-like putative nuclease [Candidatus Limnocylindrales bacterium]|nr:TM0106 family RecB-like putative nuclease [Candidatus Limnocylindrales bacterium]
MQLIDGRPVFAATDLVGFLACEHRLALERAAMQGLVAKPIRNDPNVEVVAKRGLEHEAQYLASLIAEGLRVVEIRKDGSRAAPLDTAGVEGAPVHPDPGADLRAAQDETIAAMRAGADVVFQATFFDGTWRGHADFLLKVPHGPGVPDSAFGPWHYEVADTKLARHVKASAILQICSYVEQLTAIQRVLPEHLYVVLGGSARTRERLRVNDFMAYYRRVKADFEAAVGLRGPGREVVYPPAGTYPEPVEHCAVCRWVPQCRARRRADDHLSLVAGASRRQRDALSARDVSSRRALAATAMPMDPPLEGVGAGALLRIREQARLQVASDGLSIPVFELLALDRDEDGDPVPERGLLALPAPSPGDLFLDLEGDPYALGDGVDYLFGILEPALPELDPRWASTGPLPGTDLPHVPRFHAFWSLDDDGRVTPDAEKAAFEQVIDLIMARREADPDLHVYHYAPYEPTALGRIAQRYGTREDEVDRLLRADVLVDLFRVVRQGLRIGVESYSIKRLEPLYRLVREIDLKDAGSSIVAFERWLELGGQEGVEDGTRILAEIADYNRDDVVSTLRLRDWLEERRIELAQREGMALPRPTPANEHGSDESVADRTVVQALIARLTEGTSADAAVRAEDPAEAGRWLLAQLLEWHRREDKATWWRFFDLLEMDDAQLLEAREPMAGVVPRGVPEQKAGGNGTWTLSFPEQEHALDAGTDAWDPAMRKATRSATGRVTTVDEAAGTLTLYRSKAQAQMPLPTSLVPNGIIPTGGLAASLRRTGTWVADHGVDASGPRLAAARSLLLRRPPATGGGPGANLRRDGEATLDAAVRLALGLDGDVLAIQGPPGSGKTYTGAHMIVALARAGKKVGVTANSHKVIGNLLDCVAEIDAGLAVAGARRVRIGQKPKEGRAPASRHATEVATSPGVAAGLRADELDVVGAVAWTWCIDQMADPEPVLDVLVVDEAGQMSLANVLACAPAARSIILLGDPQQLDQPTRGTHPPGAARSALGHLLADPSGLEPDRATIAPHEGLFLDRTWRLHPDICSFTSTAFYEGRLDPVDGLERQLVTGTAELAGTGLRLVGVEHAGNETASPEEAAVVVALVREVLDADARWRNLDGEDRPLRAEDVIVVAPYNHHVAKIERALAAADLGGVDVGTVDRFQGQERPVSIYAMGTSSPELAPRGLEFLYSSNRLNVATSRARGVAAVVCSPALLRVVCHTPRQMRLANGLCLAAEAAERSGPKVEPTSSPDAPLLLFPALGAPGMRRV